MAAITFNARRQKGHLREQLEAVLAVVREMLDTFVSSRMRRTAAEAEQVRPRPLKGTSAQSLNSQ